MADQVREFMHRQPSFAERALHGGGSEFQDCDTLCGELPSGFSCRGKSGGCGQCAAQSPQQPP